MLSFKPVKEENRESCSVEGGGCCTPKPKGKAVCPGCGEKAKAVLGITLESLLSDEAKSRLKSLDGFYYCKTPTCKTVYFRDKTVLSQDDVTVVVGLKKGATPATVCYCFEWTKEKIQAELEATGETVALQDIKAKMEDLGCACETLNPSGGCCLGDVSKVIKELERSSSYRHRQDHL